MKNQIYIFLCNGFADWELAYLLPELRKSENCDVITFSKDGKSVKSMGGLQVLPDTSLNSVSAENIDLLVLPGSMGWEKGEIREADNLLQAVFAAHKNVAAICGATIHLARLGYFDYRPHTSNNLFYLKMVAPDYKGEKLYYDSLAFSQDNLITANGIAPIEFAREIFLKLNLFTPDYIEKWFQLFKNGIWSEM